LNEPADRLDVLNVAVPELRLPVPITVCPALNVTVPVAVDGAILAVKVTDWPTNEGFKDELTVVVVAVLAVTVCVTADDALRFELASPG